MINASLTKNEKYISIYHVIKKLCLIGAVILFLKFLLAEYVPGYSTFDFSQGKKSTEWLRGQKLCTFRGKFHLSWSVILNIYL